MHFYYNAMFNLFCTAEYPSEIKMVQSMRNCHQHQYLLLVNNNFLFSPQNRPARSGNNAAMKVSIILTTKILMFYSDP